MRKPRNLFLFILLALISTHVLAAQKTEFLSNNSQVKTFIDEMVSDHKFERKALIELFNKTSFSPRVIELITRPYEAKPWYIYRKHFLIKKRIMAGANFWRTHKADLAHASKQYGVPENIIVAIIGVESRYGQNQGNFPVLQALTTLAFDYPKRAEFFRRELQQFLILCREQGWNPTEIKGSYAGAMGKGQFMPSSYRAYAVDFTNNGQIDLFNSSTDTIGSIANYLYKHNWQRNQIIALAATVTGNRYKKALSKNNKPLFTLKQLADYGITTTEKINDKTKVLFFSVKTSKDTSQYWLGTQNFYAITRYNTSRLYALAVTQLAQAIEKCYTDKTCV